MKKPRFIIQIFLLFLLVCTLVSPAGRPVQAAPVKAHPILLQLAAENPDQVISAIIQGTPSASGLDRIILRSGGILTRDLSIIHAYAAEIKAGAVLKLSRRPEVRWVSPDAVVDQAGKPAPVPSCTTNPYLDTTGARQVWNLGLKGNGISVAVIDSGISNDSDLPRVTDQKSFNPNSTTVNDVFGHGTHIAGIIAGSGADSAGYYQGVAPGVNLINLKVSDEAGMAYESDVVAALQWVNENRAAKNIRVVNISLNSSVEQSYHTSPMDAAVEILWFNGVVVVVSAGNSGSSANTINSAPANDPFVITVGATNEACTTQISDDSMASFSRYGTTLDGFSKPELLAPGTDIVSVLSKDSAWKLVYPERVIGNQYFRLSGTSMASPIVAASAALLLQNEPGLTPDQVKYRLTHASNNIKVTSKLSLPYLNVYQAVSGVTTESANTGTIASQLLWTGTEPVSWDSVAWNSVAWNSVAWNSVAWNSVAWNSVAWNSVYWGE